MNGNALLQGETIAKQYKYTEKKIVFRTSRPISFKLDTNDPWIQRIQILTKGSGPLQRGDNHKNTIESFKNLLLKNHWARKAQIYKRAFLILMQT
jgi:hypothetical protein